MEIQTLDSDVVEPVRAQPESDPPFGSRALPTVRILSHAFIWTALVLPVAIQISHHWRPRGDHAVIALGAYRVFSLHSPLVGVWTSSSQGNKHGFYDVGPLLFWLLAIPVHLDPGHGALWGAALCAGVVLSATVEALWSMKCWVGCVILVFVIIDLAWHVPIVPTDLMWNPNVGLVFLTASIALAWVVANGSTSWWPLLVFTGSVAAQCHLLYIAPVVPLVILAPIFCRVWRKSRFEKRRWLHVGIAVGVVCWIAPLVEELTGYPGNLSLILNSPQTSSAAGIGFGFRALSWAGSLHPIWLYSYPAFWFEAMGTYIGLHSEVPGVLLGCVLVVIAWWAWKSKRMQLASLACIGIVVAAGVVVSFGSVPSATLTNLGYLVPLLWVVGILIWTTTVWVVIIVLAAAWRHRVSLRTSEDPVAVRQTGSPSPSVEFFTGNRAKVILQLGLRWLESSLRWIEPLVSWFELQGRRLSSLPPRLRPARLVSLAVIVSFLLIAGFGLRNEARASNSLTYQSRPAIEVSASAIEKMVPSGPFILKVEPLNLSQFVDLWGLAYQLSIDGRTVGLPKGTYAQAVNLPTPRHSRWPTVVVSLNDRRQVLIVKH